MYHCIKRCLCYTFFVILETLYNDTIDTMIQFILSKVTFDKFMALKSSYKIVPLDRPPIEGDPCRAGDLINIK